MTSPHYLHSFIVQQQMMEIGIEPMTKIVIGPQQKVNIVQRVALIATNSKNPPFEELERSLGQGIRMHWTDVQPMDHYFRMWNVSPAVFTTACEKQHVEASDDPDAKRRQFITGLSLLAQEHCSEEERVFLQAIIQRMSA